jgi:hypothetical protein
VQGGKAGICGEIPPGTAAVQETAQSLSWERAGTVSSFLNENSINQPPKCKPSSEGFAVHWIDKNDT